MTIVNTFYLLYIVEDARVTSLHPRCDMDASSASAFSEICNSKVTFFTEYKVAFSTLTVTSYDPVVLALIAEN